MLTPGIFRGWMLICNLALLAIEPMGAAGIAIGLGILLGWLCLRFSRRQDRKNFIYARAPKLPVSVLAEHDDAWIRGVVRCARPLNCPHFGMDCVYYDYTIERRVTRTTTDSKGRTKTTTSWVTDRHDRKAVSFDLVDERVDAASIQVLGEDAEYHHMDHTGLDYAGFSRRHSASFLVLQKTVTVLGVKLEGNGFGPYQEIPLLVTTRPREAFLEGAASSEKWFRWFGFLSLLLGGGFATMSLFAELWCTRPGDEPWLIGIGVLGGLVILSPFWWISTYNRYVRTNEQCEAAWRQIDVDLVVRDSVIPNLVAIVKGYQHHERDLFESVARLRTGNDVGERIRGDAMAAKVTSGLLLLKEKYPDLRANENFLDLHEKLWAVEEKIAAARTLYNQIAMEWNNLMQSFPTILVGKVCGYRARDYFRSE